MEINKTAIDNLWTLVAATKKGYSVNVSKK